MPWQRLKSMLVGDTILHFLVVLLTHLIYWLTGKRGVSSNKKTPQSEDAPGNHVNTWMDILDLRFLIITFE
jgi:hypothetical protein